MRTSHPLPKNPSSMLAMLAAMAAGAAASLGGMLPPAGVLTSNTNPEREFYRRVRAMRASTGGHKQNARRAKKARR